MTVVIIVFIKSSKTYNIVAGKHARSSVQNCVTRESEYYITIVCLQLHTIDRLGGLYPPKCFIVVVVY